MLDRLRTLPLAAVLVGLGPAAAEDPDAARRWPPHFHDVAEVRVMNVDVVVTDRRGHPVAGLGRDDFELLVDGRPVEISHFYAVSDGQIVAFEPPADAAVDGAPRRRLNVLLFVDNAHLRGAHRRQAVTALRALVDREWRGDVRMMLVSYDHPGARTSQALAVRQPFTRQRGEMLAALDRLASLAVTGDRFDAQRRDLVRAFHRINVPRANTYEFDENGFESLDSVVQRTKVASEVAALGPQIQIFARERYLDAQATLATLGQLVDIAAGLPGRSVLIHVSDGMPMRGGEMFFSAFEQRFASLLTVSDLSAPGMDSLRYDSSRELEDLVARASAAGVVFYPLDVSTPASSRLGAEANVGERFFDSSLATIDDENRREPLRAMAHGTGGQAGLSPSALASTLSGIFNDFENHYSLGFDPAGIGAAASGNSTERRVRVKVHHEGLRVRSRGVLRDENPAERIAQQVLATLLTEEGENRLDIDLAVDPAIADGGLWVVPLHVRVPISTLVLLPGKSEHQARVSLWVAVRDERGRLSRVVHHFCPVRVANSEVLVALGRRMDCGVRLRMRGGRQDVAVAVQDEVSKIVATARLALDVPGASAERRPTERGPTERGPTDHSAVPSKRDR